MKVITIEWNDGTKTIMTVHANTDVLKAYEPVLTHIEWITATNTETLETEVLYGGKENA